MPEISLKAYFNKLDALLGAHAADEVIHHCRHILQYFPKNVTAYRLLGRALVSNGRWDEGREVLRRVLGVIPDDYAAHLGLSEANERMNRPDEAIWHLERALEQHPTDKELLDALRGLYRRHRGVETLKIQLTSGTVARQHLRSGAYAKAIDTLRSASSRMTERIDLKLLLAQILWQQGSEEEAAEIALDVLKVLPDCLEANKILAKLWLSFDRPSDAQRYVNRLESVDPYLAVELVQGSLPDDEAFRIDELDYQRSSQSEMARARPDWLQEISSEAPAPVTASESQSNEVETASDDEWSNWASAMLNSQAHGSEAAASVASVAQPPAQPSNQTHETRSNSPAWTSDEVVTTGGFTDLFGRPDDAEPDELAALFESGETSDDDGDPMAWLRGGNVEIVEDDELPDYDQLFGIDDSDSLPEPETNPMAWLDPSDVVAEDEEDDDDDAFAWMREANAQPDDEDEDDASTFQSAIDDGLDFAYADESLYAETLTEDPAAAEADPWATLDFGDSDDLADSAEDEVEADLVDAAVNQADPGVPNERRGLTAILNDANFDWVDRSPDELVSDGELDDWLNQFGSSAAPRADVTDVPDWLTQIEDPDEGEALLADQPEVAADEGDWLAEVDLDEDEPVAAIADPEWSIGDQAEDDVLLVGPSLDEGFDWGDDEPGDEFEFAEPLMASGDAEDEAVAVNATVAEEEDSDQAPGLVPDASKPEDVTGKMMSDNEFNWLNEPDSDADDQGELASDVPDWLNELNPTGTVDEPDDQTGAEAELIPLEEEFAWLDDTDHSTGPVAADLSDWMSELKPSDEPEAETNWTSDQAAADEDEEAAVAGEVPDWLSELEASDEEAQPEEEANEAAAQPDSTYEEEFAWLSEADNDDAEEIAAAEIPDWMNELAPSAAEAEPEAVVSEPELEWSGDLETSDEEEAAIAMDVPDWLSELEPSEVEAEPEAEVSAAAEEPEWLSEPALEDEEMAVVGEIPDWMSELEPSEAEAEPEAEVNVAAEEPEWLSEPALEDEEVAVVGEIPDWMSELEPSEVEAEPEAETSAAAEEPEWLSEPALEDEEVAVAGEIPDWMSELEPSEAEAEPEAETSAAAEEPEWLSEPALEDEEVAVAGEIPDWMSELEPSEVEAEPEAAEEEWATAAAQEEPFEDDALAETYGWLNEPSAEAEEEAAAAAAEIPSWLSDDESEPAPAEVDDFEWLNDGVSEAELTDADFEEAAEAEPELEAVAAFDEQAEFDDNQTEIGGDADGEELEPEPAHNAPDWLNAMVPGLDVEYDIADDLSEDETETEEEEPEGEIAWLVDLVEEETAMAEPASFAFSHPPMWLTSASPSAASDSADDVFPDWPADDGDDDLPEWLR